MKTTDNVSSELRKIEKEIDDYYKSNPLVKLPFATAASYLLRTAEEYMLNEQIDGITGIQDLHALGSDFITEIEHSMSWIYRECEQGGKISYVYNSDLYNASKDLFELGQKYDWVFFAFTCASGEDKVLDLELQGSTIQPTGDFFASIEYEAYNILVDAHEPEEAQFDLNPDDFPATAILNSVRVQGDRFRYKLNPKMVAGMKKYLQPLFDRMFLLPSEWQFSCYTLGDFQKVFETVCAIAHVHWTAHIIAVNQGVTHKGCLDSIYVLTYGKLIRCIARCSDTAPVTVKNVLDDLTYGGSDIKKPIPALQPLIKLNSRSYAIVPHIWICSSAERNFTTLLNRLPDQKIYEKFTNEKEGLMKERFTADLCDKDFKFISGNITNLTDVDLAIVNHSEKACLLLELKWFIAPTTAHERINKSKEIKKGICQILKLKQVFMENYGPLLEKLNVNSNYRLEGAVVSENWIGYGNVQNSGVPVIRANHLMEKLKATDSLRATMEWLKDREYLPKEGEHFTVHRPTTTIGNWTIKWYAIKSLTENAFFHL